MLRYIVLFGFSILFWNCLDDRDIRPFEIIDPGSEYTLMHYWNFNTTSSPLTSPTFTVGGASFTYAGSSMDYVNEGTLLNARNGDLEGSALRLRNPSGDFTLSLPTTGYRDVIFTFATMRTTNGAQQQQVFYTTDGTNYVPATNGTYNVTESFVIRQFNFADIPAADNNANFKIRIKFNINHDGSSGNNRFDNITMDGIALPVDTTLYLLHYWNFNSLPSGTLTSVNSDATISTITTPGNLQYPGTGAGYMDNFSPGTTLNARNNDPAGLGIRFRNPSNTRSVVISASTVGYKNIQIKYASYRTNSGAQEQQFSYSINGTDFITTDLTPLTYSPNLEPDFAVVTINLSNIPGVNNNPNFKFRISFGGSNASGSSGNNRMDNLTIEGNVL